MVATSAIFWLVFVYTLQLPWIRNLLSGARAWIDRAFGAMLIALGLRVALER